MRKKLRHFNVKNLLPHLGEFRYVKITVHFIKYEENISDFNIIYREPISEPNFSRILSKNVIKNLTNLLIKSMRNIFQQNQNLPLKICIKL